MVQRLALGEVAFVATTLNGLVVSGDAASSVALVMGCPWILASRAVVRFGLANSVAWICLRKAVQSFHSVWLFALRTRKRTVFAKRYDEAGPT